MSIRVPNALVPEALAQELFEEHRRDPCVTRHGFPSPAGVAAVLEDCRKLLFAELAGGSPLDPAAGSTALGADLHQLALKLYQELKAAYGLDASTGEPELSAQRATRELLARLPVVRSALMRDAQAALAGDPAANSVAEVVLAYPGHCAVTTYRIAHALCELGAPLIPRMMTEHAHRVTGIDIHPGATIGDSFFIDHGTGVVIGETAVIGARVRLYQGVTLGALSLPAKRVAELRHGPQRHPTLEDDVVVYAGATILGGSTVIGRGSVIGGNCWVVESVPPGSRVSVQVQADVRLPGGTNGSSRPLEPRPGTTSNQVPSAGGQGVEP